LKLFEKNRDIWYNLLQHLLNIVKGGSKMSKSRIIEEYEINPHTMMIQPWEYGTKIYSKIYEKEETFLSPFKPIDIIKNSCEYFGSSYDGRKNGTHKLIGINYKPPIMIDSHMSIYVFPTTSPTKQNCIWIAPSHILTYNKTEEGHTKVIFKNFVSCIVPISFRSFENQLQRTARLQFAFVDRIGEMESKYLLNHTSKTRKPKRKNAFYLVKNKKRKGECESEPE
jgi:competence protein ComK